MEAVGRRPRILYVVVEDWFFCSHFLGFARAARDAGFDVAVVTRVREHRALIEATGARVFSVEAERRSLNPFANLAQVWRLRRVIADEQPDIVHLIGLKPIVLGALAARFAGVGRRVVALTGLGFIGAGQGRLADAIRLGVRLVLRSVADGRHAHFLFENRSDPAVLGLDPDDAAKVTIVGGAGIDPVALVPAPLPVGPPLRVAMVARMLWSKGVDLAVEAVTQARTRGADVTLSLYGAPDMSNPRALSEADLKGWAQREGIVWHGPTRDVSGVWAAHHLAILPSRGGEGLPRTLLEAAACGRAILTSDVPGCRDFVREGIDGHVVPANDAMALADALMKLADDPGRVAAMGQAARARVLDGHTEAAVTGDVMAMYRRMLA